VPRDAAERRRKKTSRSSDADNDARRSQSGTDAAVTDVRPAVTSTKIGEVDKTTPSRPTVGGSEKQEHARKGDGDSHAVNITSSSSRAAQTSAEHRRNLDADVKTSDDKATTGSAAGSGRASDRVVNGHEEEPVVVDKDSSLVVTGGEDGKGLETVTNGELMNDQPLVVEQQIDIKPVNPDMVIFDVLHRQRHSGIDTVIRSETDDSTDQRSPPVDATPHLTTVTLIHHMI